MPSPFDKPPIGFRNTSLRREETPWVWEGALAVAAVTLLSAPEKIGKTTLLSLLLDRRRTGGQLLGRKVDDGNTILCSEEHRRLWALRQPPLDFGPNLTFHYPNTHLPMTERWKKSIEQMWELEECAFDLLVIDTAKHFLPLGHRHDHVLSEVLNMLRHLAEWYACSLLIINQTRSAYRRLAAFADIVIEMNAPHHLSPRAAAVQAAGGPPTRRRIFTGTGRYPGTLESVTAELNAEGTDYVLVDGASAPPTTTLLETLQLLLAGSPEPLTQKELLARWPGTTPHRDSVWRALSHGAATGLFTATGKGTKNDPQRFALAGQGPGNEKGVAPGTGESPGAKP